MALDRAIFLPATIAVVVDLSFVLGMKREYRDAETEDTHNESQRLQICEAAIFGKNLQLFLKAEGDPSVSLEVVLQELLSPLLVPVMPDDIVERQVTDLRSIFRQDVGTETTQVLNVIFWT